MQSTPQDEQAQARARVGMVLKDKWTLERLLGIGGMASVYLGVHRNGSKVAIKVLHRWLAAHEETVRRFLREGYLANKVEHPGVVHVLDDDVGPDGAPFLVMELLDGSSLDTILATRGPFQIKQAVEIVCKVLDVLAVAHEKEIVHRDLKPANVFLMKDGVVKVLDFGIARIRETSNPHSTASGAVLGTPSFMPPEQARGRWDEVDAKSDLWAMGATLYMLLGNRSVRDDAGTVNEALSDAISKPVPPVAQVMPAIPRAIASVIDRALAFDKASRWPDAREMRAALDRALVETGTDAWETMAAGPRGDVGSTAGATPFVHVHTPGGLAPGAELANTTPAVRVPSSPPAYPASRALMPAGSASTAAPARPAWGAGAKVALGALVVSALGGGGGVIAFAAKHSAREQPAVTRSAAPPLPSPAPLPPAPATASEAPTASAATTGRARLPSRPSATRTSPSKSASGDPLDQGRF